MSNTRKASMSAPVSQERYLSSPEYAELRGISGNPVTAKAQFMAHPAKRSLLFFLQALSLQPGGLQKFTREFLEMFPDRIGTPAMHKYGREPGRNYTVQQAREIESDLYGYWHSGVDEATYSAILGAAHRTPPVARQQKSFPVEEYLIDCRHKLEKLPGFIIELCINPKLQFSAPGETAESIEREKISIRENFSDEYVPAWQRGMLPSYDSAELPYFRDVVGALFEFKQRYEQAALRNFTHTEVSRKTFETLDRGLATGKIVMVEGESRIGKSTAVEAWANLHLGEARLISLNGITHKTGLFRQLAKALGIGSSYARSSTELQTRIEDLLERSGLMIIIDEAHHLFSSAERVYSRPELVDWINCALFNQHVPVGLICTPQFRLRMARAEKQTTWNADQFRGRCKVTELSARPPRQDLEAVARKLLPGAGRDCLDFVVGYALASKLPFPALVDSVEEARLLAQRDGRQQITFEDLERAIDDYCVPSAKALAEPFSAQLSPKRGRRRAIETPDFEAGKTPVNDALNPVSESRITGTELPARNTLPGMTPGQPSPAARRTARAVRPAAVEA